MRPTDRILVISSPVLIRSVRGRLIEPTQIRNPFVPVFVRLGVQPILATGFILSLLFMDFNSFNGFNFRWVRLLSSIS